ncbi:MAG: sigma-70 family RNA polymerase sigma factor [Planctomycetota bacterium]
MTSSNPIAESLLVHAAFVQRLAHALAGQDGDDLAQDTWAAVLQGEGAEVRNAQGWLATIVANLSRNRRRASTRRAHREVRDEAEPVMPSVAAMLEREEVRRQVVGAVVELPESLRAVILLRFFEGLDSKAIGARLGRPPSTVRAQVAQALERLRRRLDDMHGDRRQGWSVPLFGATSTHAVRAFGTVLRVTWPLRAAVGACAIALLMWLVLPLWSPPPVPPPLRGVPIELVANQGVEPAHRDEVNPARSAVTVERSVDVRGPEDLWGRVLARSDGASIVGAEVELEHRDADEMKSLDADYNKRRVVLGTVLTDAHGSFAFRVQRALQHRLAVRAVGFVTRYESMCTGGSEFVVRLDRPSFVDGVVRRTDGTPLANTLVEVIESGGTGERSSARTSTDGTFFVGGLAPRPAYVIVSPVGLSKPSSQFCEPSPSHGAHVEFVVEPGHIARGVVRDLDTGQPIMGAQVAANEAMRGAAVTGMDGRYELAGLGRRPELYVHAEGYAEQVAPVPSQDDVLTVDIVMSRSDTIIGRVLDAAGEVVPGAFVAAAADQMLSGSGSHTYWRTGVVGADGRFRIEGLAHWAPSMGGGYRAPSWQVLVRAPGMGAHTFAIPSEKMMKSLVDIGDVALLPQGTVEGRLVDAAEQPIARAEISVEGTAADFMRLLPAGKPRLGPIYFSRRTTRTGSDGTFRCAGLAAGTYEVRAEIQGKDWSVASGPQEVRDGEVLVVPDLVADAGLVIEGTLRIPNGMPLPADARFTIYAYGAMSETRNAMVVANGKFRIERLDPGDYRLALLDTPAGFAMAPRAGIAAGAKDVQLEVVPAETIEGKVVDQDGKPVRGATVYFFPVGVGGAHSQSTDDDGKFRLEAAPGVIGRVGTQDQNNPFRQVSKADVLAGTHDIVLQMPK